MVSGTVPMITPVSESMREIMTVLLRDSEIWFKMVCSTWLDYWTLLMAKL